MEDTLAKDKELWEVARERAGFKSHFITFILINFLFWIIWWFVISYISVENTFLVPLPIFSLLGWGIGLIFHYLHVYKWKKKWTQKEYNKLLKRKENTNTNV